MILDNTRQYVQRNPLSWYDYRVRVKLTRRGRAHKVGKAHIEYVMSHYRPAVSVRPSGEPEWTYTGADDRGLELRVIVVPGALDKAGRPVALVIHAMPTILERS
jgi:hypothetical protein